MKIDGIVVLYNPEMDVYDNISRYINLVNHLFVMDNADKKNEELNIKLKEHKNVTYVDLNGNKGIAQALKDGMDLAIKDGADYALTMDQDSKFPTDKYENILKYITDNQDYGIIGLNFNKTEDETPGLVDFEFWLTSGNFIKVSDYKNVRGFNPELFIDCVDFDLYEQFWSKGIKMAYINEISIIHKIGNAEKHKFFGKTVEAMNHGSLVRYYYRYRNITYLYRYVNKKFYKKQYLKDMRNQRVKILLYEKNRCAKFKMIRKGSRDGKKKILGPYKEDK